MFRSKSPTSVVLLYCICPTLGEINTCHFKTMRHPPSSHWNILQVGTSFPVGWNKHTQYSNVVHGSCFQNEWTFVFCWCGNTASSDPSVILRIMRTHRYSTIHICGPSYLEWNKFQNCLSQRYSRPFLMQLGPRSFPSTVQSGSATVN